MALQALDFIEPVGELSLEMFPDRNLTSFVEAWIEDAEARASSDAAQRAWVLYRAFTSVANRLNNDPASAREGNVQGAYLADQIAYWRRRADEQLAQFWAVTSPGGPVLQPVGYAP